MFIMLCVFTHSCNVFIGICFAFPRYYHIYVYSIIRCLMLECEHLLSMRDVNYIMFMFVCVTLLVIYWFISHWIHNYFINDNIAFYYILLISHYT